VYDYFDILGVSPDAGPHAIRRADRRRAAATHPDFHEGDPGPADAVHAERSALTPDRADAAVDFVDMSTIVPRLRSAFLK
jgi:hypothetical protein